MGEVVQLKALQQEQPKFGGGDGEQTTVTIHLAVDPSGQYIASNDADDMDQLASLHLEDGYQATSFEVEVLLPPKPDADEMDDAMCWQPPEPTLSRCGALWYALTGR